METFPIQSRKLARARRVQTAQHVFGAFMLIIAAFAHLTDEHSHHVVLPVLELLAGATLIGAAVRDRFRKTHSHVGWVELAGSAMTFVEAIAKLQERHHLLFHVLTFIPPVMLLFFGLFESRLRKRPYLGVDDAGFEMRQRMLFKKRIEFADVERYRITPEQVELIRKNGKVFTLRRKDLINDAEAVDWLAAQFESRGLSQ